MKGGRGAEGTGAGTRGREEAKKGSLKAGGGWGVGGWGGEETLSGTGGGG